MPEMLMTGLIMPDAADRFMCRALFPHSQECQASEPVYMPESSE